jgi:FhaA, N-terminal domain/FHA domain
MGVLRSIEHRIESVVEGIFGRAFRAHVQPVELARKLAKEMDDHRTVSVSRIYVPNEYVLYLAPADRSQFAEYESELLVELGDYLSEHARREGYALLSAPHVLLEEDSDLAVGEFGIATRTVHPTSRSPAAPEPGTADEPQPDATRIYRAEPEPEPEPEAEPEPAPPVAHLVVGDHRHVIDSGRLVLGRSSDCDLVIDDPNVSRRHAEVRREDGRYVVADLGSTNGVELNGRRVQTAPLRHGDRLLVGKTELVFELP